MLDTLAIARTLTDAGMNPEQATAVTNAVAGRGTGSLGAAPDVTQRVSVIDPR